LRIARWLLGLLLVPTFLLVACAEGDDDDDRVIEPPSQCNLFALETVTFTFELHYGGVDYSQAALSDLVANAGLDYFPLAFTGAVTELGDDPDSSRQAITLTEVPAEGDPPLEDPNWLRVVYSLPSGYELPVTFGAELGLEVVLDLTSGELERAFSLWEPDAEGAFHLVFLAEPSDLGRAYVEGDGHPAFQSIELLDRNCPNLSEIPCAKRYNLAAMFETKPAEPDGPTESFELWPTEHRDFDLADGTAVRVVNAWSFTHREIQDCNNGYDYAAWRFTYFVIRADGVPN
jgi:hypothetical protein